MKSKKLRLLALPLVAAMASGAGIVAGTFAYFTSQDKATVSIEAGQIKISIETSNLKTYSLGVEQAAGTFENGGSATLNGTSLVIDRITPGDKVTFDVKVFNESNVRIKYKYSYAFADEEAGRSRLDDNDDPIYVPTDADLAANPNCGTKLLSDATYGLVITENLSEDYQYLAPAAQPAAADTISIELPADRGNETQAAIGKIIITADAIQANAPVAVATPAALVDAVAEGKSVELVDDIDLTEVIDLTNDATAGKNYDNAVIDIIGNGNKITAPAGASRAINMEGAENLTLNLVNVEVDSTGKERGVSAYDCPGVELNLVGSTVIAQKYGVNVASNCDGAVVNITHATVSTGWCGVQTWSANSIINIEDSTVIGRNVYSGTSNAFGTVVTNAPAVDTVINIKNSTVKAIETTEQRQWPFLIKSENCTINFQEHNTIVYEGDKEYAQGNIGKMFCVTSQAAAETLEINSDAEEIAVTETEAGYTFSI